MTDPARLAQSAQETLERLISFDTTSRRTNLELIEFAEQRLGACGAHHPPGLRRLRRPAAGALEALGPRAQ